MYLLEESDADVEDNVEGENTSAEVGESGYSSEKASAVASPVSPTNCQINNRRRTLPDNLNESNEKNVISKSMIDSKTSLNNDTITLSALQSSSTSDLPMVEIKKRLSSEADKNDSSESNEHDEHDVPIGLSHSTFIITNSDVINTDVITASPLNSSITSKDSPTSETSFNVPNKDENDKINWLLSGLDETESSTNEETSSSIVKTKKETLTDANNQKHMKNCNTEKEDNAGINDITSGLSRLGITTNNSTHHSPTKYPRKEEEYSIGSCLNQFTTLELMSGSNEVGCEQCTEAEKKV